MVFYTFYVFYSGSGKEIIPSSAPTNNNDDFTPLTPEEIAQIEANPIASTSNSEVQTGLLPESTFTPLTPEQIAEAEANAVATSGAGSR